MDGQVSHEDGLNAVDWNETAVQNLQDTYEESYHFYGCGFEREVNLSGIGWRSYSNV